MREKTFIELFYNLSSLASFPLFITEKPLILEKIICNPRFEKSKEKFEILKNIFQRGYMADAREVHYKLTVSNNKCTI